MLKNITFSADETLIAKAREQAKAKGTTLNEEFREWLKQQTEREETARTIDELFARLSYVDAGRKFTREEMNERR